MARVHGKNGVVYVGIASSAAAASPLPNSSKWTADFGTDRKDATSFGDTTKVTVAGLPKGEGSVDMFWDSGTAQTYTAASDGQARNCYFYPTTPSTAGPYWFGTAFFDFAIETAVDDVVKVKSTWSPASSIAKVGN